MADLPLEHRSLPPADHGADSSPAVVVLHGLGADEGDLLALAKRLPDDRHVLSVRAPDPHGPGFSWFEFEGPDPADARPVPGDLRRNRDLLDDFVDAAVERYGLDADRVGLLGFSQGAVLGIGSLVEAPERYAWCVASHGFFPESVDPADDVDRPVLVGAGTADEVVPPARSAASADRLRELGCSVSYRTFDAGHGVGPDESAAIAEWVGSR